MSDPIEQKITPKRQRSADDVAIQALKVAVRERKALDARVARLEGDMKAAKVKRDLAMDAEIKARAACKELLDG